jgi:hypothetical protein
VFGVVHEKHKKHEKNFILPSIRPEFFGYVQENPVERDGWKTKSLSINNISLIFSPDFTQDDNRSG